MGSPSLAAGGKRPFWMHQLVEYILGGALVGSGLQSRTPTVPAVLGGLIMLNAALTKGALGAFRAFDRRVHKLLDPVVILVCIAGAVQPVFSVDNTTRLIILGITAVHIVVFLGSNFEERPKRGTKSSKGARNAQADRSTELGKTAGRAVGSGVNAARRLFRSNDK
jgi:hypothetical protein